MSVLEYEGFDADRSRWGLKFHFAVGDVRYGAIAENPSICAEHRWRTLMDGLYQGNGAVRIEIITRLGNSRMEFIALSYPEHSEADRFSAPLECVRAPLLAALDRAVQRGCAFC